MGSKEDKGYLRRPPSLSNGGSHTPPGLTATPPSHLAPPPLSHPYAPPSSGPHVRPPLVTPPFPRPSNAPYAALTPTANVLGPPPSKRPLSVGKAPLVSTAPRPLTGPPTGPLHSILRPPPQLMRSPVPSPPVSTAGLSAAGTGVAPPTLPGSFAPRAQGSLPLPETGTPAAPAVAHAPTATTQQQPSVLQQAPLAAVLPAAHTTEMPAADVFDALGEGGDKLATPPESSAQVPESQSVQGSQDAETQQHGMHKCLQPNQPAAAMPGIVHNTQSEAALGPTNVDIAPSLLASAEHSTVEQPAPPSSVGATAGGAAHADAGTKQSEPVQDGGADNKLLGLFGASAGEDESFFDNLGSGTPAAQPPPAGAYATATAGAWQQPSQPSVASSYTTMHMQHQVQPFTQPGHAHGFHPTAAPSCEGSAALPYAAYSSSQATSSVQQYSSAGQYGSTDQSQYSSVGQYSSMPSSHASVPGQVPGTAPYTWGHPPATSSVSAGLPPSPAPLYGAAARTPPLSPTASSTGAAALQPPASSTWSATAVHVAPAGVQPFSQPSGPTAAAPWRTFQPSQQQQLAPQPLQQRPQLFVPPGTKVFSPPQAPSSPLHGARPAGAAFAAFQPGAAASAAPSMAGATTTGTTYPRDGRPPCVVVAFGFGGNVIVSRPGLIGSLDVGGMQSAAPAELLPFKQLLQVQQGPSAVPAGAPGDAAAAARQQGTLREYSLLEQFPGPLVSVKQDKVVKFVEQRISQVGDEEYWCQNLSTLKLLLQLLLIAAKHQGQLRQQGPAATLGSSRKGAPSAEAEVVTAFEAYAAEKGSQVAIAQDLLQPLVVESQSNVQALTMQRHLLRGQVEDCLNTAMSGGLWGPALLLGRALGEKAWADVTSRMLASLVKPGVALHTALGLLAGQGEALVQQWNPAGSTEDSPAARGLLPACVSNWEQHALMVASLPRCPPADALLIKAMADTLLRQANLVEAAHVCCMLGAYPVGAVDPAMPLSLLGADHLHRPRTYASIAALQRSQVYQWTQTVALPNNSPQQSAALGPMMPFYLYYATLLAQYGLVPQALQYCQWLGHLQGVKGAPQAPPLVRLLLHELQERLQVFAQAHGVQVPHDVGGGSLIGSLGRWLDKGVSKLMGADAIEQAQQGPARGSQGALHTAFGGQAQLPHGGSFADAAVVWATPSNVSIAGTDSKPPSRGSTPSPSPLQHGFPSNLSLASEGGATPTATNMGTPPAPPALPGAPGLPPLHPNSAVSLPRPGSFNQLPPGSGPPSGSNLSSNLSTPPFVTPRGPSQGQPQAPALSAAQGTSAAGAYPGGAALQQAPTAPAAAMEGAAAPPHRGASGAGGGVFSSFGRLALGTVKSILGGSNAVPDAQLGEENKFYYDETLGKWVEGGLAVGSDRSQQSAQHAASQPTPRAPSPAAPPAAPPTAPPPTGPPPIAGGPSGGPNRFAMGSRSSTSVRARYVDTLGGRDSGSGVRSPSPVSSVSLVPAPSFATAESLTSSTGLPPSSQLLPTSASSGSLTAAVDAHADMKQAPPRAGSPAVFVPQPMGS